MTDGKHEKQEVGCQGLKDRITESEREALGKDFQYVRFLIKIYDNRVVDVRLK